MIFGSLFAGIGGLDLGLERAGMECRWQVEIDGYCRKVLAKHWPNVKRYGDVKQLTGAELEPVNLICGGYPCQPFSQAGKRKGTADERHLWPEFARLAGILRPRYMLLENVPGHLSLGFGDVLGDLARLGYDAEWRCYRATDFGASHIRKRVFIVANAMRRPLDLHVSERQSCEAIFDPARTSGNVADSPPGRRGIMREPSGRDGLTDGSNEDMEYSPRPQPEGSERESGGMRRRGIRQAGEQLADPSDGQFQESRRGSEGRTWIGSTGAPILADSASEGPQERRVNSGLREHATAERTGFGVFAPGPSDPRWPAILTDRPDLAPAQPSIRGMADGVPDWLDRAMQDRTKRLSRLGNAVIPQIAEEIGRRILRAFGN